MEHVNLHPASANYVKVRYLAELPWIVIATAGCAVAGVLLSPWLHSGTAVFGLWLVWWLWLIPAQVRNLGWLETEDELLLSKGKLWHTFTVVPYGRIQFVDVKAGPVERMFGLKHVELHTASSTSDSVVRGLKAEDADGLRDRLAVKARERMSGL